MTGTVKSLLWDHGFLSLERFSLQSRVVNQYQTHYLRVRLFSQFQIVVKPKLNQSNSLITFDTQLKTTLKD